MQNLIIIVHCLTLIYSLYFGQVEAIYEPGCKNSQYGIQKLDQFILCNTDVKLDGDVKIR